MPLDADEFFGKKLPVYNNQFLTGWREMGMMTYAEVLDDVMKETTYTVLHTTIGGKIFKDEVVTRSKLVSIGCSDERIAQLVEMKALKENKTSMPRYANVERKDAKQKQQVRRVTEDDKTTAVLELAEVPLSVISKDTKGEDYTPHIITYLQTCISAAEEEFKKRQTEIEAEYKRIQDSTENIDGNALQGKLDRKNLLVFEVECSIEQCLKHMERETRPEVVEAYRDVIARLRKMVTK